MAPAPSSGASACKHCTKALSSTHRAHLNLEALCLHELPPHPEISQYNGNSEFTLVEFLNAVLPEAFQVNFDDDTWTHHGKYPAPGKGVQVSMPPLRKKKHVLGRSNVPIEVEKRSKGEGGSAFLARRSCHDVRDIGYLELDSALAQNHCQNEAVYDPSIFDGNEILQWGQGELRRAVADLDPDWMVKSVQMSIYEMFHEMPRILGKPLLKDRVFHVLCITAHSSYVLSGTGVKKDVLHSQSHTLQLPINFKSFQDVPSIISRSHFQPQSRIYKIQDQTQATERQKKHNGNKVVPGIYCSLERLRQAPGACDQHRWDMMTRSDARGSTGLAPRSIKRRETLDAIAKDVQYVLEHIKTQRLIAKGDED